MHMFKVYRVNPPAEYVEANLANGPEAPDMGGCVFDDGRVAVRWMTGHQSAVWWDSWEEFKAVHIDPHGGYGTRVEESRVFTPFYVVEH